MNKVFFNGLLNKIEGFINRVVDFFVVRVVSLFEAAIDMLRVQLSTFKGTVTVIIVAALILEAIGIKIIGLSIQLISDLMTVIQPIMWPLVVIVVVLFVLKERK